MLKNISYQTLITYFISAHVVIFAIASVFFGLPLIIPVCIQLFLSFASFLCLKLCNGKQQSLDITAICLVATPAVFVYQLTGQVMQLDAHMYFFATLAMLIGFKSIRSVLFATTFIALHHLSLNFLMPYAVFPEGANFMRVIFHAVIVLVETAVIVYQIKGIQTHDAQLEEEGKKAQEALQKANEADEKRMKQQQQQEQQRKEELNRLANQFDTEVGSILQKVENMSKNVNDVVNDMASAVQQTMEKGQTANDSSSRAMQNINVTNSQISELSKNIGVISQELKETSNTAKSCAHNAQESRKNLDELQGAIDEIDVVLSGINDVAEQTNLLALNATIEAARAGDAGKGFSVVANEVKTLASKTREMTEEISQKVSHVKNSAVQTISVMSSIIESVETVNQKTSKICTDVERGNEDTLNISNDMQSVSNDNSVANTAISEAQQNIQFTTKASESLQKDSNALSVEANNLKRSVESFLSGLRE